MTIFWYYKINQVSLLYKWLLQAQQTNNRQGVLTVKISHIFPSQTSFLINMSSMAILCVVFKAGMKFLTIYLSTSQTQ